MFERLRGLIGRGSGDVAPEVEEPEIEYSEVQQAEMEARKRRSIERLKAEGVPFIDWLPYVDPSDHVTLRTPEEAAERAFCLFAAAMASDAELAETARQAVRDYRVEHLLTPRERKLIFGAPTQHERIQASWGIEAVVPLLWHVGYVPDLYRPDRVAETGRIIDTIQDLGPHDYYAELSARTKWAVLDEADLIYRYHWAVRDAGLNGRETPAKLDGGVVMERHRALNWLIGYADRADWDDVTTDT
ncbi:MAG: DUF4272 domain-containing protein [Phenylobacterium sp.]|nr:DUF4272 domain-containing protein [Phenylobacterium sp.]